MKSRLDGLLLLPDETISLRNSFWFNLRDLFWLATCIEIKFLKLFDCIYSRFSFFHLQWSVTFNSFIIKRWIKPLPSFWFRSIVIIFYAPIHQNARNKGEIKLETLKITCVKFWCSLLIHVLWLIFFAARDRKSFIIAHFL